MKIEEYIKSLPGNIISGDDVQLPDDSFRKIFEFLELDENDIFYHLGCGEGKGIFLARNEFHVKKAVGIDKSKNMVRKAKKTKISTKENYYTTDLESSKFSAKFDIIFSMESLYYSVPMEPALNKVYKLLKNGGIFYCGTDFYKDNHLTTRWIKDMKIPMDLRSESEWKKMFKEAGFKTRIKHVTDPKNKAKWKREFGTLFLIGVK